MERSETQPPSPDRIALAIFALLAAERQEHATDTEPRSVEAVLGDAGFTPAEVTALTNGNYQTVKTRMRRARRGEGKG